MTETPAKLSLLSYILPRLQDVLFISIFVAVVGYGPRMFNLDGDLGRHITIGEHILDTRQIPTTDIFSHTMYGQPLTPHEWGAQVIFALLHRIAGLDAIVWFCALLLAFTFTQVYRQCMDRSGLVLISLTIAILAAAAASIHWLARPHLFTILLVVAWLHGLERLHRGNPIGLWYFPLLMLIWVNLHGAYISGFVLWGIYLSGGLLDLLSTYRPGINSITSLKPSVANLLKKYLVVGGLSFLVTFLNPSVWRVWETSVGYLGNRYLVSHTAEYLPPNFHSPSTWPFLVMLLAALVILALSRRRVSAIAVLMIAGWTAMSLYSARNIPLYAVSVAPFLAAIAARESKDSQIMDGFTALQMRLQKVETNLRGILWPLVVVSLLGLAAYFRVTPVLGFPENVYDQDEFPVEAVDWLADDQPEGTVFNYFPWGGYLLYRSWPSTLVFIDGQTDFYGEELTREYEQVISLTGDWEAILGKYRVAWVLMPADSLLVRELERNPDWQLVYEDTTAGVLVRSNQDEY
jgi:hypothetical protein